MAWSWSHTVEAEQNVVEHIRRLDNDTLVVVYAEWSGSTWNGNDYECTAKSLEIATQVARSFVHNGASDLLAEAIIDWVTNHRVCDNGGFNAHICPYGCHTVPFDEPEDDDDLPF